MTCYEIHKDQFSPMIDLCQLLRLIEIELYYERLGVPANLPSMLPWVHA